MQVLMNTHAELEREGQQIVEQVGQAWHGMSGWWISRPAHYWEFFWVDLTWVGLVDWACDLAVGRVALGPEHWVWCPQGRDTHCSLPSPSPMQSMGLCLSPEEMAGKMQEEDEEEQGAAGGRGGRGSQGRKGSSRRGKGEGKKGAGEKGGERTGAEGGAQESRPPLVRFLPGDETAQDSTALHVSVCVHCA